MGCARSWRGQAECQQQDRQRDRADESAVDRNCKHAISSQTAAAGVSPAGYIHQPRLASTVMMR
jgi:hypothetical protein